MTMDIRLRPRKYYRWYKYKLLKHTCDFNPSENLVMCSAPRGGSTWLAELLTEVPRTALLFEPMYVRMRDTGPFQGLSIVSYQPVPESASWPELEAAFNDVLRGK